MFLQNLRAKVGARLNGDSESGFTLIELLVVMLILGILAAIALPAFFNQKDKAGDARAKEYVHSAQVAMETYATDHNGSYLNATKAALVAIEPTLSSAPFGNLDAEGKFVPAPAADSYTVVMDGTGTQEFLIKNTAGALSFLCKTAGEGGCPSPANAEGYGEWD